MIVFEFRAPLVVDIYPLNGNTSVVCTCAQYIYVALTNRACGIIPHTFVLELRLVRPNPKYKKFLLASVMDPSPEWNKFHRQTLCIMYDK